jgi:hypothetical protein
MKFMEPHLSLVEKKEMLVQLTDQLLKTCPVDERDQLQVTINKLIRFIDELKAYRDEEARQHALDKERRKKGDL